jgi:TonB-linked SusC/RagA family outer membrane protein
MNKNISKNKTVWNIRRKIILSICLCICTFSLFAQNKITGKVTDASGEVVVGANVMEKGTSNGVMTDQDGNFSFTVSGNAVLQISFIGYISQEIAVGNRTSLDITLVDDTQALDEVVVVGYGTQKKVNLSGAVASIGSDKIANRPITNATLALQGLAANMTIAQTTGSPALEPEINIRGYTSINGGGPLILVDNMPVDAGFLARLNPSDIESASVLQDAASSAIYGGRAAFGVVLITTKTAKSEKLQVSADFNYGIRSYIQLLEIDMDLVNFMEVLNAMGTDPNYNTQEQLAYAQRRKEDPTLPEILYPGLKQADRYDYYSNINYVDLQTYKSAPTYTGNVSISQKGKKLSYAISGGYYRQEGLIVAHDPFNRYNVRGVGTYQLTDRWKFGSSISYARTGYEKPTNGGDSPSFLAYIRTPPLNPDGTATSEGASSLLQLTRGGRNSENKNDLLLNFNTAFDVIKDVLTIKGDANYRIYNRDQEKYSLPNYFRKGPTEELSRQNTPYAEFNTSAHVYSALNFYADFHKTFASKHYVQALVGFNQESERRSEYGAHREDMISESVPTVSLATGAMSMSHTTNELALRGAFGRLNYIFDNKYILEFNGRYDGTSRYPKKNRFGAFPSASAAWALSNEQFFAPVKDLLKISGLKFRGSYGVLGNQIANSFYPYIATMGSGNISSFIDSERPLAIYQPSVVAGDLTWETVRTVNGGLDLSLFNGKIDIVLDIYTRYTEGMLTQAMELPSPFGAGAPQTNAADLKTNGWGLNVGYRDKVNVGGSPLSWNIRILLSDSRSWITKFSNPTKSLGSHYEGEELGEIWGFEVDGLFASDEEAANAPSQTKVGTPAQSYKFGAGDIHINDLDHNNEISKGESTVDNPGDMRVIGNTQIRLPYSIDLGAEWKGFDLRLFFQGVGKRDWYFNSGRTVFWSNYDDTWQSPAVHIRDRWTPDNPNGYYPRLRFGIADVQQSGELVTPNSRYLQDGSYLRLKNLTVGYTLPKQLTEKWGISHLRFYLSGENLLTVNNIYVKSIDPEILQNPTTYPMQRIVSLGLNLNF